MFSGQCSFPGAKAALFVVHWDIVKVLRDIWFKITQKHQIWYKCGLYHTISISDERRDGCPPGMAINRDIQNGHHAQHQQMHLKN